LRIFVTGVTGFIGQNLVENLSSKGYSVIGLTRQETIRSKPSVYEFLKSKNVDVIYGDLLDYKGLLGILRRMSNTSLCVIHLAGIIDAKKLDLYNEVNVKGTRNLLNAILESKVDIKQIIHMSTAAIYGPSHLTKQITEEMDEYRPETYYEKSKLESENIAREHLKKYGLPVTILRPVHVYGPLKVDHLILKMIKNVMRGLVIAPQPLAMDLVYVKNLTQAIVSCIKESRRTVGQTYIITDGRNYSTDDVIRSLSSIFRKRVHILRVPNFALRTYSLFSKRFRYGLSNIRFSGSKFLNELNVRMSYDITSGLEEYVYWLVRERFLETSERGRNLHGHIRK